MNRIATALISGTLVLGAYALTFGLPASLTGLVPGTSDMDSSPSGSAAPDGGGPRGGPDGRSGAGATTVVTAPLVLRAYDDTLRAIGSTVAWRSVDVVASASGTVTATSMQANGEVAEGDVLVQLDDRTETLNLEIAQAELDQARRTVERYETLANSADVTAVDIADAGLAARLAEANVGLARIALDDRTIRAPIAGRAGLSEVEVGERVTDSQVIVTIDDTETLLIEFELPERSIGLLEPGRIVLAGTPVFRGRVFEGEIVAFDSRLDEVTRSVTVRARIENPDRTLWSGMTFAIRLIEQTDPLPMVPATALTWTRQGSGVWTDTEGVASRVPVTILHRQGDRIWIEADIAEGASIVTEGAQKLREGGAVREAGTVSDVRGSSREDPA